jgi:hypothetical protein
LETRIFKLEDCELELSIIEYNYIVQDIERELKRGAINLREKCVSSGETSLYACLLLSRDPGAPDQEVSPKSPP